MGVRVRVLDPSEPAPAAVAAEHVVGSFRDPAGAQPLPLPGVLSWVLSPCPPLSVATLSPPPPPRPRSAPAVLKFAAGCDVLTVEVVPGN